VGLSEFYKKRKDDNMTKFYSEIAKYYDDIFPTGDEELQLISETAGQPPKDILDAACGSGGYSKNLSNMGYSVTAIDLDEKMVQSLKEKDEKINARVLNMLYINELPGTFDLIFCIGNSLVHLNSLPEIGAFLNSCKNKLKTGGKLILQIVNYDRILERGIKSLPTIINEEKNLSFERYYNHLPNQHRIDFMTILNINGEALENHVDLFPVKSEELKELLEASGFTKAEFYGSFEKDKYEPMDSFQLVIIAE
jgi:2-polyprenyl-3-methyl-5-hydroxy-6-metoxy-1,4-benzoquinol methylase